MQIWQNFTLHFIRKAGVDFCWNIRGLLRREDRQERIAISHVQYFVQLWPGEVVLCFVWVIIYC